MSDKYRVMIATYPFGRSGRKPLDLLEKTGWELITNSYGRRLKGNEVADFIRDADAVIAGTEPYPKEILQNARLKVISRVGIGLDNVPLKACQELGIAVTYTPDAPSQAVAELAMGNIINLLRRVHMSDRSVREGAWNRYMGLLLEEITVGIVGVGRIGKRVCKLLQPFGPRILACDLEPDIEFGKTYHLEWVEKKELFKNADLVSLHIPINEYNYHYINRKTIAMMKTDSYLINTSRGPVVDEQALTDALFQKHLAGVALDVFEKEPYEGPLARLDNVVLTAHIGASTRASRYLMELGAAEDCIKVLKSEQPTHDAILETLEEQVT